MDFNASFHRINVVIFQLIPFILSIPYDPLIMKQSLGHDTFISMDFSSSRYIPISTFLALLINIHSFVNFFYFYLYSLYPSFWYWVVFHHPLIYIAAPMVYVDIPWAYNIFLIEKYQLWWMTSVYSPKPHPLHLFHQPLW